MLKTLALWGALALGLLAGVPALAQTSQPPVTVTSSAYVDLGAGPLTVENRSTNPIQVIAADTQPTPSSTTLGHVVGGSAPPRWDANETKHLWAIAIQAGSASVITTPISSSGASLTWPGTAAATTYGTAPSGTVPGVNAAVTSLPALATGANVIGGVTQSGGPWSVSWSGQSVGLSGTLPAFAATPTVNLGTLNGAATAANQPALNGDGGALAHVTNFPATQPISAASLPLPSGAATASNQNSTAAGVSASNAQAIQGVTGGVAVPVSGTFWQTTQPSSIADGSDVTLGAKADAAYAGSGNASVVAALKGLYTAMVAATPAGSNTIGNVNQSAGAAGFAKLTDGTNTAAVKAASTAPVATDPAAVVVLSPNTPTMAMNSAQVNGATVNTGTGASSTGTQRVAIASDSTMSLIDNTSNSGSASSAAVLSNMPVSTTGYATLYVTFSSVGSGNTVNFEGSNDSFVTSSPIIATRIDVLAVASSAIASPSVGAVYAVPATHQQVRVRVSTFGSGTVTAQWTLKASSPNNVLVNQGSPSNQTNGWIAKLSDGTNITAVKAASTAAGASDPSAVVALSPNSPVPAGAATIGAVANAPYLSTQTQVNGSSGNIANASAAASLGAVASKTNYLSAVEISAAGATAGSVVNVTITGLLGGTLTYPFAFPTGATTLATPLILKFVPPLQASAANTAITATLPAGGSGNTNASVNIHGWYQ